MLAHVSLGATMSTVAWQYHQLPLSTVVAVQLRKHPCNHPDLKL